MTINIKYGKKNGLVDVTQIVYDLCKYDDYLYIPKGDCNRADIFGDHLPNILKVIIINNNFVISHEHDIYISLITGEIILDKKPEKLVIMTPDMKLEKIHSTFDFKYGNLKDEYPEQIMSILFLKGNEKILEIGGNVGRNSLVIASILMKTNENLVVLETDNEIANQLIRNRNSNNFTFFVENSALSKRELIQSGWNCILKNNNLIPRGYLPVQIIDYETLCSKYNINFDTLIVDCEGSFYYILQDMPEILKNIKLIIMENDYNDIDHKSYVDFVLTNNDFKRIYFQSGGWGPCSNNFYEVWRKNY